MSLMKSEASNLAELLERALGTGLDFVDSLPDRPAACVAPPDLPPGPLPERGMGSEKALDHFRGELLPHLSASAGPRYWGFVTGGATPAALVGFWLSSVADQNPSISGTPSPRRWRCRCWTGCGSCSGCRKPSAAA